MYRRKNIIDVAEPKFADDLQSLGFDVIDDKQELASDRKGNEKRLHHSERLHHVHWEAIRGGVRKHVVAEAASRGLAIRYLSGPSGDEIAEVMPTNTQASVPVMTSDLGHLQSKSMVIVIVGEGQEDLGVFSAWDAVHERGIKDATIVGILDRISKQPQTSDLPSQHALQPKPEDTPGLIVLNPGELLFSYSEQRTFTQRGWFNRPLQAKQHDSYAIDPIYNLTSGHRSASEHINTCFRNVIPKLIGDHTRLCVIGIGDGASNALNCLDDMLTEEPEHSYVKQLSTMMLIQPTHILDELRSTTLKDHLRSSGQCIVLSEQPRLDLVQDYYDADAESQEMVEDCQPALDVSIVSDDQPLWPDSKLPEGWSMPGELGVTGSEQPARSTRDQNGCATYSAGPEIQHTNSILPAFMSYVIDIIRQHRPNELAL